MTKNKKNRLHEMALSRAKAPWGVGWAQLTADVREALLAREALMILLGQCDSMPQFDEGKRIVREAMGYSQSYADAKAMEVKS